MEIEVKSMQGETTGKAELPADIFEAPINVPLMHQAYVRQLANARLGTHKTKSRGEVRGGGRKPWRQKGTGRARAGTIRSPIWRGGGKVHTPRPRSYAKKMTRKMRRAALRSALSVKAADRQIVVIDKFEMDNPSTKEMMATLDTLANGGQTLVLLADKNVPVEKSVNNLHSAKILRAHYLNIRDLLGYDTVILPLDALDVIKSYLGQGS